MATYMAAAWLDLAPGADAEAILDLLRAREPPESPELYAWVSHHGGWSRVELSSSDAGYHTIADLVAGLMAGTDIVARSFVALDHDEYGAEHVVLDRRDGVVRRVHHVFVYPRFWPGIVPYRAGEPWRTDLPAAVPTTRSPWWGHLVDGPAAWAAVAELYGVPAERMGQAAYEARRAYRELQIVWGPIQPWLDALGITPSSDDAATRPVKLWPGPVWREAAIRFALPHLPGTWLVLDDELILEPVGLIARGVGRSGTGLMVLLHPLYLPLAGAPAGWLVSHDCHVSGYWPRFSTVEEGEPYMRRLVTVAHDQILPYLERCGTLEGYQTLCRQLNADHPNPQVLHRQAATEIVLTDYRDATATLDELRRFASAHMSRAPWLADLARRADEWGRRLSTDPAGLRAELLAGVEEQRRRRGLPATGP
jgi:hypothetical protein